MRILLDTRVLLWSLSSDATLGESARREIESEKNVVFVSMASLWEIRIKESLGKVRLPHGFYGSLNSAGFEILPITLDHIEALGKLPSHHRDPFDRMLVAQSRHEHLTLMTRDAEIRKYAVDVREV